MVKGTYSLVFALMFCLYGGNGLAQELQVDFSIEERKVKHLGLSFIETLDPFQEYAIPFLQVTVTNPSADSAFFSTFYLETPYLFYLTVPESINDEELINKTPITRSMVADSIGWIKEHTKSDTMKVAVFDKVMQRRLFRKSWYATVTQALLSYNFRSGFVDSFEFIWPMRQAVQKVGLAPKHTFSFHFDLTPFILSATQQFVSFSVGSNNPFNDFSTSQETEVVLDVLPYRKALLD